MKKYKRDLKALAQCSPARVSHMIRKGDDDFILAILDAVWTTLDGRVELFTEQLAKGDINIEEITSKIVAEKIDAVNAQFD